MPCIRMPYSKWSARIFEPLIFRQLWSFTSCIIERLDFSVCEHLWLNIHWMSKLGNISWSVIYSLHGDAEKIFFSFIFISFVYNINICFVFPYLLFNKMYVGFSILYSCKTRYEKKNQLKRVFIGLPLPIRITTKILWQMCSYYFLHELHA